MQGQAKNYQVVKEIFSYTGQVHFTLDTELFELAGRAYPRAEQDSRRAVSTRTDYDFPFRVYHSRIPSFVNNAHSGCFDFPTAFSGKNDLINGGLPEDGQVRIALPEKIGGCASHALVHGSGCVAAAVRIVTAGKHIVLFPEALGLEGLQE